MRRIKTVARNILCVLALVACGMFASTAGAQLYVVENNDVPYAANSVNVYQTAKNGTLNLLGTYATNGSGLGASWAPSQAIYTGTNGVCIFATDALTNDIAAFQVVNGKLNLVSNYKASGNDGSSSYIGLALNGNYLYAIYPYNSQTIAVWQVGAGCTLTYQSNTRTQDQGFFPAEFMAVTPDGKTLVVSYQDGDVGSFKVGDGTITYIGTWSGSNNGRTPQSVTIDSQGRWAIFPETRSQAIPSAVSVCPIGSDGTLGACTEYGGDGSLGSNNINSFNLSLSPDNTTLYVNGQGSSSVQSLAFNEATGAVSLINSCSNSGTVVLPGNVPPWGIATATASGKGGGIYVAQGLSGGIFSYLNVLSVNRSGCLKQVSQTTDTVSGNAISISSYPRKNP